MLEDYLCSRTVFAGGLFCFTEYVACMLCYVHSLLLSSEGQQHWKKIVVEGNVLD
jgi:hypothetical protein